LTYKPPSGYVVLKKRAIKKQGGNTMSKLYIEGKRNGYGTDQCGRTLTVGELIALLSDFDEDMSVYLRNDNGYTYGSITEIDFNTSEDLGEEDEE
jgi:hypothetical protein